MTSRDLEISNLSGEVSLKELILKIQRGGGYLLSRWTFILFSLSIGCILGFMYSYFSIPVYTATTTFVLEDGGTNKGMGNLGGIAAMVGVDVSGGGGIFQGDNIIELYKSRNMIVKTLLTDVIIDGKPQMLAERYAQINNLQKKWSKESQLINFKFQKNDRAFKDQTSLRIQDSLLGNMVIDINKNYLIVTKPDKKLSIIRVDVNSRDEIFSKSFNDQIVAKVNEFYVQTKTKKSLDNIKILEEKRDSVKAIMNGAIYNAAKISDETPNLNPTKQLQRIAPIQRSQFNAETNKALLAQIVQNLEMTRMSFLQEKPLIQEIDSPIYPLSERKFSAIKGIIIGGLIFGFLAIIYLMVFKTYKKILADDIRA